MTPMSSLEGPANVARGSSSVEQHRGFLMRRATPRIDAAGGPRRAASADGAECERRTPAPRRCTPCQEACSRRPPPRRPTCCPPPVDDETLRQRREPQPHAHVASQGHRDRHSCFDATQAARPRPCCQNDTETREDRATRPDRRTQGGTPCTSQHTSSWLRRATCIHQCRVRQEAALVTQRASSDRHSVLIDAEVNQVDRA